MRAQSSIMRSSLSVATFTFVFALSRPRLNTPPGFICPVPELDVIVIVDNYCSNHMDGHFFDYETLDLSMYTKLLNRVCAQPSTTHCSLGPSEQIHQAACRAEGGKIEYITVNVFSSCYIINFLGILYTIVFILSVSRNSLFSGPCSQCSFCISVLNVIVFSIELTGVPQLLYFAHLLSPSYIRSQNIVCQCGEDVLMSSTLIRSLTSRCVPSQAL